MKREKSGVGLWLSQATGPLKFPPDRRAVRAELLDHITDRADAYQRIFPGMDRGEAERKAVEQMGDAREVGSQLAKIHHPWAGFLWYGCRALLVLSMFLVILFVILQPKFMNQLRDGDWETERLEFRYKGQREKGTWTPPEGAELAHYKIEITDAARMEETWRYEDEGKEPISCQSAALSLKVTAKKFWNRPGEENMGLERYLTAVDSEGKKTSFQNPPEEEDSWRNMDEQPLEPGAHGFAWQSYELVARNITTGAEYLDLSFDNGAERFTLRVYIPPEITFTSGKQIGEGDELPW